MTQITHRATILLALLFVSSASGNVIFSRRIYKAHGASYQQIFTWDPASRVLKQLTHTPRDHYAPTCDGGIATGRASEPKAKPDSEIRNCNRSAKRGELTACGNDETLVISRSGKQIGQFQIQVNTCPIDSRGTFGKCETPIRSLDWTEDGKWLLVGEEGLNDGSGQRQEDYYVVNLSAMKLTTVASAFRALWLPGRDQIVYVTPQNLASFPGGNAKQKVWVQHLMFFDPLQGKPTAITSGLSKNVDPAWCEGAR